MPRRSTFDKDRARALYAENKTDVEIADVIGATASAVKNWRRREGLYTQRRDSGGTRPEVTVDIPEGLQPAVRKDSLDGFEPVQIKPPEPLEPPAELPAAPDPEPPKMPMPEEPPTTAKQDAEDPVTVEIIYRGCHVCVDADRLEQISVAGKILAGISAVFDAVSNSDTNKTPTNK